MSIRVLTWVLYESKATLADRLVLLALADTAHDDGSKSFPSVATIAHKARVDKRTAQRSLRALEGAGAITATGTTKAGTTVYRVNMGGGNLPGGASAPRGAANNPGRGGRMPPDPLVEPSAEPSATTTPTSAKSAAVREIFDYWVQAFGKNPKRVRFNAVRSAKIRARLREGYTADELKAAIRGAKRDPHLMGQNSRARAYTDLVTICRDGEIVERLAELAGPERTRPRRSRAEWVRHFMQTGEVSADQAEEFADEEIAKRGRR